MQLFRPFSLLLAALCGACGAGGPEYALSFEELPVPSGEGAVEPVLSPAGDGLLLSWLEPAGGGAHRLLVAALAASGWTEPSVVTQGERLLVSWADVPFVAAGSRAGVLWASWLERGRAEGYGYDVRVARSDDGGATWSEPWTPHEDGTDTEHGFASAYPLDGGLGLVWLDGRGYAAGEGGAQPSGATALYHRVLGPSGLEGPEELLEARVCDCCRTDVALAADGPVLAFRGRSEQEIRDILVRRRVDGVWREPVLVHEDGWETGACPVNGPAVAALGETVWVAWFTAAGGEARVRAARSRDGARSFGEAVVVDDGSPGGRVDVVALPDGSALVSWLERAGAWPEVRVRRVDASGRTSASLSLSEPGARANGTPRMGVGPDGAPLVVWTDAQGVAPRLRLARIDLRELGP